ncbi:unnamed protein product [Arctogadus glacialis]
MGLCIISYRMYCIIWLIITANQHSCLFPLLPPHHTALGRRLPLLLRMMMMMMMMTMTQPTRLGCGFWEKFTQQPSSGSRLSSGTFTLYS